ncbi:MAG TPA: lytic transglycosylase domain-containing protein [Spirochaetales bacterium]|nr:lytic transglycosylase domain-containing protein [Spirochaetales bacterium]
MRRGTMLFSNHRLLIRRALSLVVVAVIFVQAPLRLHAQEEVQQPEEPDPMELPLAQDNLGPASWYFEAKKIELGQGLAQQRQLDSAQTINLMEFLYGLAFRFGEKESAKEAGNALASLYLRQNRLAQAQATWQEWLDYFGPNLDVYRSLIDLATKLGDMQGGLALVGEVRKNLPTDAKKNATELNWFEYTFRAGLGDYSWAQNASSLVNLASIDSWNSKSLNLYATAPGLDPEVAEKALLRASYAQKDYNATIGHAVNLSASFYQRLLPRVFISETGKAFLNAGRYDEGLQFFAAYFVTAQASEAQATQPQTTEGQPGEAEPNGIQPNEVHPDQPGAPAVLDSSQLLETIRLVTIPGPTKPEQSLWMAAYYVARCFLALGKSNEASIIFLELSDVAPTDADADGALWYWLDITMKQIEANSFDILPSNDTSDTSYTSDASDTTAPQTQTSPQSQPFVDTHRSLEIAALTEASLHWKDPYYFDDILEAYVRRILKEKTWDDIQSLFILIGSRTSPNIRTKLIYVSARLLEEGFAAQSLDAQARKTVASQFFHTLADDPSVDDYYRAMAAWRLGMEPPFLAAMPDLSQASTDTETAPAIPSLLPAEMSLIQNYLAFDLDDLAAQTAMNYLGAIDKYTIAQLALILEQEGQYYPALRLARDAIARGAANTYPELYGILYPKAWNSAVSQEAAQLRVPEALIYGIIRSESAFNPKAVSYAGAVGLAQLMPATAAETAVGLKMTSYSLTNPEDNLRIGMAYYGYMLARFGNKPMRAMFAYNAGPSRMKTWNQESGELPDDVLLEALHLAQTRQYGKNIVQAALAYAKIHYGIDPDAMLDYLVYAKPLPASEPAAPQLATQTAQTAQPGQQVQPTEQAQPAQPESAESE